MGPHSVDLRERVVDAYRRGEGSIRALAALFHLAANTVENWLRLERETGEVLPRPHGGGVAPVLHDAALDTLRALVAQQPDATLPELRARLERACALRTSEAAVCRALGKLGLTRKRRRVMRPSRRAPTSRSSGRRSSTA